MQPLARPAHLSVQLHDIEHGRKAFAFEAWPPTTAPLHPRHHLLGVYDPRQMAHLDARLSG